MKNLLALILLAWPSAVQAQSVTLPATVQIDTPGLIVVRATAVDADSVAYYALTPSLQTFPPDIIPPKANVFLGLALTAGQYTIAAVPAKTVNGKAVIGPAVKCVITVGTPPPPVPPIPPTPPTPTITIDLSAAWAMETDPGKIGQALELKALYDYAVTQSASATTWQDLATALSTKAAALGVAGKLQNVQTVVATALTTSCPGAATLSNTIEKACAAAVFSAASKAVGGLQK